MATKHLREGFRERAAEMRHGNAGTASRRNPRALTASQGRAILALGLVAMVLLLVVGQWFGTLVGPSLKHGEGVIVLRERFDAGSDIEEYLLGIQVDVEEGAAVRDIMSVPADLFNRVAEGDRVPVRYRFNTKTQNLRVTQVELPLADEEAP